MRRDWLTEAFGAAIADIRQKVVEEPYFGRVVTPRHPSHFYGRDNDDATDRDRHSPDHEHDFDR